MSCPDIKRKSPFCVRWNLKGSRNKSASTDAGSFIPTVRDKKREIQPGSIRFFNVYPDKCPASAALAGCIGATLRKCSFDIRKEICHFIIVCFESNGIHLPDTHFPKEFLGFGR